MGRRQLEADPESQGHEPPEPGKGDAVHAALRAGIGAIPIIGAVGAELFTTIIQSRLERRRNEGSKESGGGLRELGDDELISTDGLSKNDAAIDTVLVASQITIRTARREKKEALRNAVLDAASLHPIDESLQQFPFTWLTSSRYSTSSSLSFPGTL